MTRDNGLDPILGPWMRRNALAAPDDLLDRVMTEVETMTQRPAAGMSWFGATPAHTLMTATAIVAAAALAVGILIGNNVRIGPAPSASASPTPTVTRFTDPSGDGPEAYDITAVTTSVVDDDILRIRVELATRWPDEGVLRMWFVPNDASHTSGGLGAHNRCDPYGAGYSLFVTSGSGTFTSHTHDSRGDQVTTQEETLNVTVDANVVTVDVPLRFLRDPQTLGVALDAGTVEAGFDAWPDRPDSADDGCQPVPLASSP